MWKTEQIWKTRQHTRLHMWLLWVGLLLGGGSSVGAQGTTGSLSWHWKVMGSTLQILGTSGTSKDLLLGQLVLPAPPAHVLRWGPYLYIAARRAGLLVIDVSSAQKPTLVAQKLQGSDVLGLRLEGTLLVLEVARYQFQVFSLQQPSQPTALSPQGVSLAEGVPTVPTAPQASVSRPEPTSVPKPSAQTDPSESKPKKVSEQVLTGRVVRIRRGWVVIDKGKKHGLSVGTRVAILSHQMVRRYDPGQDRETVTPSRELTAVITITQVYEDSASGQLGRGDRAYVNDFVETTDKPLTSRLFFPPRPSQYWRLRFGLTPVIGVNASSVGLLSFSSISYSFEFPFKIEVAMSPLSFVLGSPLSFASGNVIGVLSYNTNYIELMLGAGYQGSIDGVSGFILMQGIRLGAVDGLNFVFINQLVLAPQYLGLPSSELKFQIGALHGEINIPLTSRITLYMSGGGGSPSWFYGLIGIRTYIWGQGGGNTFVFSGGLGGAGLIPVTANAARANASGPLISAEIDWRF